MRIVSVASVPDAGRAGAWHFDADQDVFDLRVTLEGEGTFELAAELLATDGRSIARHARTVELDGRQDVDLSGFAMPEPDGYRLMVEVSGPGVRSRQDVSVRRG